MVKRIIRSVKASSLFANTGKQDKLTDFIAEYRRVSAVLIDKLWDNEKFNRFGNQELISDIDTKLSARALQACLKQSNGVVKGVKRKQQKRLFIINKLKTEGKLKKARILQAVYDKTVISKPKADRIKPQLDSRFFAIEWNDNTSFDGWITFSSLGTYGKISVPIKKYDLLNSRLKNDKLLNSVLLSENSISLCFEIVKKERVTDKTIGIDIGVKSCISVGEQNKSKTLDSDNHGWTLDKITEKLSRKKSGSKAFLKTVNHRKNFIRYIINQIDFNNVSHLNRENIKNLRKNKRVSRKLARFTYRDIFTALDNKCQELGVQVSLVNPRFTSQRCSVCGWTQKANRKSKIFCCKKCNFTLDADENASRNLSFQLSPLKNDDSKRLNLKGFFWNPIGLGKELIVPSVQQPNKLP